MIGPGNKSFLRQDVCIPKFHEKVCSASFSKKIGIDPFYILDTGLFEIAALGIGIGNRKSNLKNLESGISRLVQE